MKKAFTSAVRRAEERADRYRKLSRHYSTGDVALTDTPYWKTLLKAKHRPKARTIRKWQRLIEQQRGAAAAADAPINHNN